MTPSQCVGVIDLGSNTVLLLVLERGGRVLRDEAHITRLGEGVFHSGVLAPAAVERTRRSVAELARIARQLGAEPVVGVGTEALRRARDGLGLLESLCAEGHLDEACLLEGQQEAAFAIEASRRAQLDPGSALTVIDVGGGSTELAWTDATGSVHGISLPLGSVRLTEALLWVHPIPPGDLGRLREAVDRATSVLLDPGHAGLGGGEVIAVAGTATTLAAMELGLESYDPQAVEGFRSSRPVLSRWIGELARLSVEERRALPGLEPGRADVIVAGLVVLYGVLTRIAADGFRVSGRGVRHGVALRLLDAGSLV